MTNDKIAPATKSIMVVGAGISGLTTAIEAAEVGYKVLLVEQNPYLGGRVVQLNQYFPKLCPPTCGLEINLKRIKDNSNIIIYTLAEVENIEGCSRDYKVKIKLRPRYVNDNCTCCGDCSKVCELDIFDEFNLGMKKVKGAYLPFNMAFPQKYVISPQIIGTDDAINVERVCKYNAVDLSMKVEFVTVSVGSIIWATGWEPYDATKIDNLGFSRCDNVITNMMLERLASLNGPTLGKIVRNTDSRAPKAIAFVQCAGSRDENHLPYCSYVCCMATLKHARYLREQMPDALIYIFYIDIRAFGNKYEKFYDELKKDDKIIFIKGKVAEVTEVSETKDVIITAEDSLSGEKIRKSVEMVVLATGMQPSAVNANLPADLKYNESGFIINDFEKGGMFAIGCANKPSDVVSSNQSATGMAIKAIQTLVKK